MDNEVLIAIIGLIPAVASPFIAQFLSNKGLAGKSSEIEIIDRRLELIKKFQSLKDSDFKSDLKKFVDEEMEDIINDLQQLRDVEPSVEGQKMIKPNWLNRILLNFDLISFVGKVYRGFYWFFAAIAIVGFAAILLMEQPATQDPSDSHPNWAIGLLGASVYMIIALIFRSSALRRYKKVIGKQATHSSQEAKT